MSAGASATWISSPPMMTADGTSICPLPRRMLASVLTSQSTTAPPNTTFE